MRLHATALFAAALTLHLAGCPDPVVSPAGPPTPATWSVLAQDASAALLSIGGRAADDVYAVGADKGLGPLVLHWDGAAWTRLATGTRGDLWWVHALPDGPVMMAGNRGTVLAYADGAFTRMDTPGFARDVVYGIWGRAHDDLYAVGAAGSRNGFIWRYDGDAWSPLPLPADLPTDANGDLPGFFKVWGTGDEVWVVGGAGVVLRSVAGGPFETFAIEASPQLFTVHGNADTLVAVGAASGAALLECDLDDDRAAISTRNETALLQGVCLTESGVGYATGANGVVLRREASGAWARVETGIALPIASLHAVWIDPDGGVWSVGGNVLTTALDQGALIYGGAGVPAVPGALLVDEVIPPSTCPDEDVARGADGSIARRWNEQILASIRRDIPRPGVHARNLYHLSAAMWDAWAAWDSDAAGLFASDKYTAADVDAARTEAISYAAYRVLAHRYDATRSIGATVSQDCYRAVMAELGFDPDDTTTAGDSPRAVGNRIGAAIIAAAADDGANEAQNYADNTAYEFVNPPTSVDRPGVVVTDPTFWQPLNLAVAVTQNGIITDGGAQGYIGPNWGWVTPFALERPGGDPEALYFQPTVEQEPIFETDRMRDWVVEVIDVSARLDPTDGETMDISPGAYGNNPLGANTGEGHPINPVTGEAYAPQIVPVGDFGRVLAEYWADGPHSETPPGHWNKIANDISDHPDATLQIGGEGEPLDRLEWDVKLYMTVNGAVHDAAIASWELKRSYNSSRPFTLIRYMAGKGQSSDPDGPSYDPHGLPLVPGLIEVVTAESAAEGERHAHLARYLGKIAIRSWNGEPGDVATELGGVGWILGVEWMPYQLRTFVTPAFPGFTSGHSTFSRSAAEALTRFTGSPYFPGGIGEFVAPRHGYLRFETGPSVEVRLQWATYYDAADQAGISRIWGGIHISADDFFGRETGATIGALAHARAMALFAGAPDRVSDAR